MQRFFRARVIVSRGVLVFAVTLVAGCGGITPSGYSEDVQGMLSRGEIYVENLSVASTERLGDAEILALGYLERLRLGLGSPFRLIEYVLRDPELPERVKQPLAYGMLARSLKGRTYYVDPAAMELARLTIVPSDRSSGAYQLRAIERAIASAPSAAAGERTVRLGYLLAASERTVEPGYSTVVAHVAALFGDRRRAREDASLLLRAAARREVDPLVLLVEWRREARFRVEQPGLVLTSARDEEAEARDGPALALALRTLAQRQSASITLVETADPGSRDEQSLLDGIAAARLHELTARRDYPPQAPVAVAVAINRDGLLNRPGLLPAEREARHRFVEEAWNEERLVAGAATLRAEGAFTGQRAPLILLQAATFLRAWNQEEPWLPGDPGPTARELEARFGLTVIRFDDDVPEGWRQYYLSMLGRSLGELHRVLPALSLRGLTIRIGDLPVASNALALHEPGTRTLYLPPKSGAGTLAHELAHDLDWQLARRRYGARGGYATDMAVRDKRGDRIAAAMMELSSSLVQPTTEVPLTPHMTRPAEVFARGIDWLVAAVLARDGRLGGYLTSFQDPILTGYGTTRGPDITGGAVPALLSILDGAAPVAEPLREWVLDTYGPNRSLTATELARAVTDAGSGLPPEQRLQAIETVGARSFEAVSDCRFGSADALRRLIGAQRALASASMSAAARGAAVDAVHALADAQLGPEARDLVDAWLAWRMYGAPEPLDAAIDALAPAFDDILLRATLIDPVRTPPGAPSAFQVIAEPTLCGGNPFAADTPVGRFRSSVRSRSF